MAIYSKFVFRFGLSYTSFKLNANVNTQVLVKCRVTNDSEQAGVKNLQLYASFFETIIPDAPVWALLRFKRHI